MIKRLKKNSKKGFTLIELLVVIAVLAILILLALPRLAGFKEKAELARIQNDIKATESYLLTYLVNSENLPGAWADMSYGELGLLASEDKLYEKQGLASSTVGGEYKIVDENFIDDNIKSKLDGDFYANEEGKVYYANEKADGLPPLGDVPADYVVANEMDFSWVTDYGYTSESKGEDGYYQYTGTDDYIIIPETIQGDKLTSYYNMFSAGSSATVKGVSSPSIGITEMISMFESSPATELDVRYLKTPDLKNAQYMFKRISVPELNLNYTDFSQLTSTTQMFEYSNIGKLNFNNADLSSSKQAVRMFGDANIPEFNFQNPVFTELEEGYGLFQNLKTENLNLPNLYLPKFHKGVEMFSGIVAKKINLEGLNMPKGFGLWGMMTKTKADEMNFSNVKIGHDLVIQNSSNSPGQAEYPSIGQMFDKAKIGELNTTGLEIPNAGFANGLFSSIIANNIYADDMKFELMVGNGQMFEDAEISGTLSINNLYMPNLDSSWGLFGSVKADKILFNNATISKYTQASRDLLERHDSRQFGGVFSESIIRELEMNNFNGNKIEAMSEFFTDSDINSLTIKNFNAPSANTLARMFDGAKLGDLIIDGFKVASDDVVTGSSNYSLVNFMAGASADSVVIDNFTAPRIMVNPNLFSRSTIGKLDIQKMELSSIKKPSYDGYMSNLFSNARITDLVIAELSALNSDNWGSAFKGANITEMDLSGLDTTGAKNVSNMFEGAKLDNIDLSKMNFSSATNMSDMFKNVETNNVIAPNLKNNKSHLGDFMMGAKANKVDISGLETTGGELPQSSNFFAGAVIKEVNLGSQVDIDNFKQMPLTPSEILFKVK